MTNFEEIKSMNIDELAEYLDEHWSHGDDLCMKWWDKKYCSKCEPVICEHKDWRNEVEFSYCELEKKCRFFSDRESMLNSEEIMKLWLESEV